MLTDLGTTFTCGEMSKVYVKNRSGRHNIWHQRLDSEIAVKHLAFAHLMCIPPPQDLADPPSQASTKSLRIGIMSLINGEAYKQKKICY